MSRGRYRSRPTPAHLTVGALRNRAIIELFRSTRATISSIATMQVEDFYRAGGRTWVRLGVDRIEPVDRPLETCLDEYITAARIADELATPLFRYLHGGKISRIGLRPSKVSDVIQKQDASTQRRLRAVERPKRRRGG